MGCAVATLRRAGGPYPLKPVYASRTQNLEFSRWSDADRNVRAAVDCEIRVAVSNPKGQPSEEPSGGGLVRDQA